MPASSRNETTAASCASLLSNTTVSLSLHLGHRPQNRRGSGLGSLLGQQLARDVGVVRAEVAVVVRPLGRGHEQTVTRASNVGARIALEDLPNAVPRDGDVVHRALAHVVADGQELLQVGLALARAGLP